MSDPLVTVVAEQWRTRLGDACRSMVWSPQGRLLVVGADGRSLIDQPGQVTAPMSPDPVHAAWLGERRVAVVDAVSGVVFAGSGNVDTQFVEGARLVDSSGGRTVVAGANALSVFGHPDSGGRPDVVATSVGCSHSLVHTVGALWAVGGTGGVTLVDAALGCTDPRIELEGVAALFFAPARERLVATDLAGSIHVLDLRSPGRGIELDGYPDPVRHIGVSPAGDVIVAAADDELTWWWLDDDGKPDDEPNRGIGHDMTITALSMSVDRLVATGDASGMVRIWSPQLTDYPVASVTLDDEVVALRWSPDGRRLALAAMSGEVAVVEVKPGLLA
jgi:WD40 repeat protein